MKQKNFCLNISPSELEYHLIELERYSTAIKKEKIIKIIFFSFYTLRNS